MVYLSCSYIPHEIPLTAGMHVKRGIFEGPLPAMEGYLPRDFCPYARAFLRQYGDDHVVVIAESCDAMRRVYDALRYWSLAGAVHFVDVPRTHDAEAVSFYAEELRNFASNLMDSNAPLPADFCENLKSAIGCMNRIRIGLAKVFDLLSERQVSAVTATRLAMSINQLVADFSTSQDCADLEPRQPRSKHVFAPSIIETIVRKAEELIDKTLSEAHPLHPIGNRIPVGVTGTCLLDLSLLHCIESAGLDVVFIDSCLPSRTYAFTVDNESTSDPFYALAKAYLRKPPCPRMFRDDERIHYLHGLTSDCDARGLIYFAPKFCDQAYYDFLEVKHGLKSPGRLPVLLLEGQYGVGRTGQALTRIAAFREMLESRQIVRAGTSK